LIDLYLYFIFLPSHLSLYNKINKIENELEKLQTIGDVFISSSSTTISSNDLICSSTTSYDIYITFLRDFGKMVEKE